MSHTDALTSARTFARNLNILLKYIRLYGGQHQRTLEQVELTWRELSAAADKESGLLLGVAEETLLIDGVAVDGLGERSFAAMLKMAGISSMHFSPAMERHEFEQLVYAFASGKPNEAARQLRQAAPRTVKVNEVKFVAQDAAQARATELVAQALGDAAGEMKEWLSDPEKLVQLIAAAEGSRQQNSGQTTAPAARQPAGDRIDEPEMQKVLRILARFGALESADSAGSFAAEQLVTEDPDACTLLRRAVHSLPATANEPRGGSLADLAEKLAIRFARQQFERGEVKVDAVHQLMERMAKEIESLRKLLNAHEDKMHRAGMVVESHADVLDRQFWASMPEAGKKSVLLSSDAWCIPPRNVRNYVAELLGRGDRELAGRVLRNYVRQLANADEEARKKTGAGVSELADLLASAGDDLLTAALQAVGLRLQCESVLEHQTLLSAAYVRLTQEASQRSDFVALRQSLNILERLHEWRPRTAMDVRPRITVENRLGEFIAEAVRGHEDFSPALLQLLRQVPMPASEHISVRFSNSERRAECDRFVALAGAIGPSIGECVTEMLRAGNPQEFSRNVGIASRLRPQTVAQELRRRMASFSRTQQDAVVRQLGAAGAPQVGELLAGVLEILDPLVVPEALDEIGLGTGQVPPASLLEMAAGEGPASGHEYIRVKAMEALGRLRESSATELLSRACAGGGLFQLGRTRELRVVAAQALALIDPERIPFLLRDGFSAAELGVGALPPMASEWSRSRRYPRINPNKSLSVLALTDKGRYNIEVSNINLGGGLLAQDRRLPRRGDAVLEWQSGLSRVRSQVVLREVSPQNVAFEVVNMTLEGRGRLRKLLVDYSPKSGSNAAMALPLATGRVRSAERTSAM